MDIRQVRAALSEAARQKALQEATEQQRGKALRKPKKQDKADPTDPFADSYWMLDTQDPAPRGHRTALVGRGTLRFSPIERPDDEAEEEYEETEAERNVREEFTGSSEFVTAREAARRNRQPPPTTEYRPARRPPEPPATRRSGPTDIQRRVAWLVLGTSGLSLVSAIVLAYLRSRGSI